MISVGYIEKDKHPLRMWLDGAIYHIDTTIAKTTLTDAQLTELTDIKHRLTQMYETC